MAETPAEAPALSAKAPTISAEEVFQQLLAQQSAALEEPARQDGARRGTEDQVPVTGEALAQPVDEVPLEYVPPLPETVDRVAPGPPEVVNPLDVQLLDVEALCCSPGAAASPAPAPAAYPLLQAALLACDGATATDCARGTARGTALPDGDGDAGDPVGPRGDGVGATPSKTRE